MARRDRTRQPPLKDWHLWAEVKRTVVPLRPEAAEPDDDPLPIPAPDPSPAIKPIRTGPPLPGYVPPRHGRAAGDPIIEPRMRRKLRRGHIVIDGTIDLHGMRQHEARATLERFLKARWARGDRTILVITGKGLKKTDDLQILDRGVLRSMLPIWLREPALAALVAGWDAAAQEHGGEGAFYVRLKRARQ